MSLTVSGTDLPRSGSPQGDLESERFVEQQLVRTGVQVKITNLFSVLMVLIAGVLAFLLVVAIVDHWVLALEPWGRWCGMVLLLAGILAYAVRALGPLLVCRVNPAFAARVIEQSEPFLKNSLINYLFFRADRAGLPTVVYTALQQRAAADLSRVRVEAAVDRGHLIRIGYVLSGMLVLCAAYTILSPKSPFQTARRILAPWADVPRPSRVRIEDVTPGHATVYCGDRVPISAQVYDARDDEPVRLFYSTNDQRVTAQVLAMKPHVGGLRYVAHLPPDDLGIQQDLDYWITAGDATTDRYRLTVRPAPAIWVQQVEYEYPPYTQRAPRVVQRQGDMQALEGTRVTVRALANMPIQSAAIEFFAAEAATAGTIGAGPDAAGNGTTPAKVLAMQVDSQQASGSFVLELDPTRTRSQYASYQLTFTTPAGQRSQRPVLYRLEVARDLAPEIEILVPARARVELPEDGQQLIEARSIDPDFGLRRVTLRAVCGGQELLARPLLDAPQGYPGQALVQFLLRPRELPLPAGSEVTYWLVAEDNRLHVGTGRPDPNITKTPEYQLVIVPSQRPTPREAKPDAKPEPGVLPNPSEDSRPNEEPAPSGTGPAQAKEESKGRDKQSDGAGGSAGEQTGSQTGNEQDGNQGKGQQASGGQSAKSLTGDSSSAGDSGSGGGQRTSQPGDPDSAGSAGSAGSSGEGPANREEPLHDGEVFERALQRMQQQKSSPSAGGQEQTPSGGEPKPASSPADADGPGRPTSEPQGPRPEQAGRTKDGQTAEQTGAKSADAPAEPPSTAQQPQPGSAKTAGGTQAPDKNLGAGSQQPSSSGQGGTPRGPAETGDQKQPGVQDSGDPRQPGQGDTGQSGPGQPGADKRGAMEAQAANRDRPKQGNDAGGKPQDIPPAQSPSISKHQSDSKGGEAGDRSGGGKQGAGQGANQPGQDSPGSNSAADEGAGAANESGAGDTANLPGNKQRAEAPTGSPGDEQGPGSGTRPGSSPPDGVGKPPASRPGDVPPRPGQGSPAPASTGQQTGGQPWGGGQPRPNQPTGAEPTSAGSPGEKPNLDYARQATDLVLEYLRDQQQKPDDRLLRDLGWTPEDLQKFVDRWESLKRAAAESDAGRRELEESLRSLGLRPDGPAKRHVNAPNDPVGGLREAGTHSDPPPGYAEQFQAYKKGTARTDDARRGSPPPAPR
jgi:hypothetical protein